MSKVYKKYHNSFTQIDNKFIYCKKLSPKAKGMFLMMWGLPSGWEFSIPGLCSLAGVGEAQVKSALSELKDCGCLIVKKLNPSETDSGRFEYDYILNDCPNEEDADRGDSAPTEQEGGFSPLETVAYNNTNNNNISHISSKDDIFDKGHSQSSARSETQSSGKLFSSEKSKTTKSSIQKINSFITACQREAIKKEFSKEVLQELDVYFRMLAEMNCLLPSVSIAQQLSELAKVPAKKQVQVVKDTISRGWRSLQYVARETSSGTAPSWDTANPDAFTPKTEEEKKRNKFEGVDPDHIF